MKKLFMLVAVAGLALSAQAEDNGWGLFGTYWKPSDGDGTAGPGARITAELFPDALLDVRVSNFNDLLDDGDLDVMPIDLGFTLQFPLSKTIGLHAGAGVGYYLADGEGADDAFGFNALGGVDVELKRSKAVEGAVAVSLFAEVMYRAVDIDNEADADLGGVGTSAGLMVTW